MSAFLKRPREAHKARTLPTEPFHMHTRRGGKVPNGSVASYSDNVDGNSSRRESTGSADSQNSYDSPQEPPAKRLRVSSEPMSTTMDNVDGLESIPDADISASANDHITNHEGTPIKATPSPEFNASERFDNFFSASASEHRSYHESLSYYVTSDGPADEDEAEEASIEREQSDDNGSSDGSSDSEAAFNSTVKGPVAPSTDITPAASGPGSPASTPGSFSNNVVDKTADPTPKPFTDGADDSQFVEDYEVPDVDDGNEIDDGAKSDGGRPRRRFPGKRRANHANPAVEAAMRRQLELKTAFRAISRCLKPALAQLAKRSIRNLKEDEKAHELANEHAQVQEELRARLELRQSLLHRQQQMNGAQLAQKYEAERAACHNRFNSQVEDFRDELLDKLELDMLAVARAAGLDVTGAQQDTEDEDDVVPRVQGQDHKYRRRGPLDPVYDSRSRIRIETATAVDKLESRMRMQDMLHGYQDRPDEDDTTGFTVMDSTQRDLAALKRAAIANASLLTEAAAESERRDLEIALEAERTAAEQERRRALLVPNEQAYGLQLLSDTATRPSLASPWPFQPDSRLLPQAHFPQDTNSLGPRFARPSSTQRSSLHLNTRHPSMPSSETTTDRSMPPPSTPTRALRDAFTSPTSHSQDQTFPPSPGDLLMRRSQERSLAPAMSPHRSGQSSSSKREGGQVQNSSQEVSTRPQVSREKQSNLKHILQSPERDCTEIDQVPRHSVGSSNTAQSTRGPSRNYQHALSHDNTHSSTASSRYTNQLYGDTEPSTDERLQSYPGRAGPPSTSGSEQSFQAHQLHSQRDLASSHFVSDEVVASTHPSWRPASEYVRSESPTAASIIDARESSELPETRDRKKAGGLPYSSKTSREERGGQSRKQWKQKHRQHKSTSGIQPPGTPVTKSSTTGGSHVNLPPRPSWEQLHAPQGSSPTVSAAGPYHAQPVHIGQPPPPTLYNHMHQYPPDYYNPLAHRNSFPLVGAPPAPPPWQHHQAQSPPNPLFAMPHGSQSSPSPATSLPPPPPGMTTDQYHAQFPNAGRSLPAFSPTAPIALPSTHAGQQQFGMPLAPAAPDPRYGPPPFSYGPTPPPSLPAFAQQQRQEGYSGEGAFRRRHQSEGGQQGPFRPWFPDQRR